MGLSRRPNLNMCPSGYTFAEYKSIISQTSITWPKHKCQTLDFSYFIICMKLSNCFSATCFHYYFQFSLFDGLVIQTIWNTRHISLSHLHCVCVCAFSPFTLHSSFKPQHSFYHITLAMVVNKKINTHHSKNLKWNSPNCWWFVQFLVKWTATFYTQCQSLMFNIQFSHSCEWVCFFFL